MKSPCTKDCPRRSVSQNCHMSCAEYKAFVAYRTALCEKHRKESHINYIIMNHPKERK